MTLEYDLLSNDEIEYLFKRSLNKVNITLDVEKTLYEWVHTKEWFDLIYNIQIGFLKIKTRQKSIFIRFFDSIAQNFYGKSDQSIWNSYIDIQHYCTKNIEMKYITYVRSMIQSFYHFYIDRMNCFNDKSQLKNIMLDKEPKKMKRKNDSKNILGTNYPIGSKFYQLINIECHAKDKNNNSYYYFRNFYINSDNLYLIELLRIYLRDLKKTSILTSFNSDYFRYILYFFEESLSKVINKLDDFSKSTFFNQVKFYKELYNQGIIPSFKNKSYIPDLARFYRYIDNKNLNIDGDHLFKSPTFNTKMLRSKLLKSSIEEDYQFVLISKFDSVPESDKWTVIPEDRTFGSTQYIYRKLNFELILDEKLRNDLKTFIWNTNNRDHIHRFKHLTEFLNDMCEYSRKVNETSFSLEFITFYYIEICDRTDIANQMKNSIIFSVRTFLRSIQIKYNIPENQLLIFKELPRLAYYSGNPILPEDFKVINKYFYEVTREYREELYILFKLSIMTKLRPGELLNLERNCITFKNDKYGAIEYYSKTSSVDKVTATFTIDIIRELEHALEITHSSYKIARQEDRKYIFIGPRYEKSTGASEYKVMQLNYPYRNLFHNIIKKLYDENLISRWYTTYSCRDTHINNAFELLEEGKINSFELTTITGNSANIARKHYLSKDRRTRHYLENLYEVSLLNDDIEGSIEESKASNLSSHIVQDDMGACNSIKCVKETSYEDSSYKCLTCKYFVTTLDKLPLFEERVKLLKEKVNDSTNKIERDFYIHSLELNLSYLGEMYSLRGETY